MCRVKNLQQTSQDFDSWFSNLNQDFKVDTAEPDFSFDQLLPTFDVTLPEPYPSPTPSAPTGIVTKRKTEEIDDALMLKRQRQNEAAKRCRQKKLSQLQQAQEDAKRFERESFELSVKLAVLEREKQAWLLKEREMQTRINMLKQQLDESHLLLIKMTNQ